MRVGKLFFNAYALLGDGIVIADEAVSKSYHHFMTQTLGVEINFSKSLVSKRVFDYANRLIYLDVDYYPIGVNNLLLALKSYKGLSSFVIDAVNKGLVL